jgi:hypothetical protein
MTLPVSFPTQSASVPEAGPGGNAAGKKPETSELGQRFEQMLWTEMLSYAGLDKAFSQGGGEAAASFSRYVVEAIAKDLAEKHPMGFGDAVDSSVAAAQTAQKGEVL